MAAPAAVGVSAAAVAECHAVAVVLAAVGCRAGEEGLAAAAAFPVARRPVAPDRYNSRGSAVEWEGDLVAFPVALGVASVDREPALERAARRRCPPVLVSVIARASTTARTSAIAPVLITARALAIAPVLITARALAIAPVLITARASATDPGSIIGQTLAIDPASTIDRASAIDPASITDRALATELASIIGRAEARTSIDLLTPVTGFAHPQTMPGEARTGATTRDGPTDTGTGTMPTTTRGGAGAGLPRGPRSA